ncbi:MAG: trigger factor [Zetaproteobacteria bacterium]|nr:trigger factor [Zetaproteobacteria bacterium]
MHVQVEEINSVQRKLLVDVPKEYVEKTYNSALAQVRNKVNLPGYRKGKAPAYLIKSKYEASLKEEVMETIIRNFFSVELVRLNLSLAGRPQIDADPAKLDAGLAYQFSVMCDIEPQFELEDAYKQFKLVKNEYEVTEKSFEAAVNQLRREQVEVLEDSEETSLVAEAGHLVSFTEIEGLVGDKPVAAPILSKNQFLIGLDSQLGMDLDATLSGAKVGDEIPLRGKTTDAGVTQSLAAEELEYSVKLKVNAIRQTKVPEFDEELAQALKFDSLDALRERVRADLEEWAKNRTEQGLRGQCLALLREKYSFELPPVVVDSQIDAMIMERVGANFGEAKDPQTNKFLQSMLRAEEVRSALREEAKRIVHNTYILRRLAVAEGIVATEADDSVAEDKQIMQTYDKALDKVLSFAEITVKKIPLN